MIFVIDDNITMATCIARACKTETKIFTNAVDAMEEISRAKLPDLIFLDVLLDGPDGFTFLNEMVSYNDTRKIPIVLVSSLDFSQREFMQYGVVGYLNKDTMVPEEILEYVKQYAK